MSTPWLLLTAYKGTGKDTFCRTLQGLESSYTYNIYGQNKLQTELFANAVRIAFADSLKDAVHSKYEFIADDSNKDQAFVFDPETKEIVAPRVLYIREAKRCRDLDPDYFCKKALDDAQLDKPIIITDFRNPNELTYVQGLNPNVITIRIFRKSVEIPNKSITSEHYLDHILTDLVVTDNQTTMEDVIKVFPQYSQWIL